jgi:hypothetical protein
MTALPTFPRSAYINPPMELSLLRNLKPAQHGWGRGWPDDCPKSAQLVTPAIVRPRDGLSMGRPVRRELAPLFTKLFTYSMELAPEWELRTATEPSGGQGGAACRAIKGSNPPTASNHSTGRAWDCNTKGNPMRVGRNGAAVDFISRQPPVLVELAAAALCYWGGWYWDTRHAKTGNRYYVDAMHLEFVGRVSDVPRAIAQLDAKYQALRPQPEPEGLTVDQVKAVQEAINALGWQPPLRVDGRYGALTDAAVNGIANHVRSRNEAKDIQLATLSQSVADALPTLDVAAQSIERAQRRLGG